MSNDEALENSAAFLLRDFFRKCWPQLGNDHEAEADGDQEKREELAAGKASDQTGIRFAEIFDDDSKNRVKDKKQPSEDAVRLSHLRSHEPKNREQDDAFEETFIKLGWMPRG